MGCTWLAPSWYSLNSLSRVYLDRAIEIEEGNAEDKADASQKPTANSVLDWNGPQDPQNPFNWPVSRKWMVTVLACFMTFVVQVNGTAMTSAWEHINESFGISDIHFPHSYWPVLSWTLGGAAAPMLALPLMENFGIRRSYLVSILSFRKISERGTDYSRLSTLFSSFSLFHRLWQGISLP